MEEPRTTAQVPHPDLLEEMSGCSGSNDCSCEGNRQPNSLSMPICFLVKEQAKSQVAIQDLQTRLRFVESVQTDILDTLVQFRSNISEVATPSFINITDSPSTYSTSKVTFHSAIEPPRPKQSPFFTKAQDGEFREVSSIVTIQDQPLKHFDSTKSKDSALESDKQDSGLDSDCREHVDGQHSIKSVPHWVNQEANDQLLQLLDEISFRSECLQKQLAVTEDNTILTGSQDEMLTAQPDLPVETCSKNDILAEPVDKNTSKFLAINDSQKVGIQATLPSATKINSSGLGGFLEGKSFRDKSSAKRVGKTIDSTMVSSILKETNVVDLQRQALIYLVDNAVLNTRLREMEQALAKKDMECDKIENSLREETRLFMVENRELRVCLEEQILRTNVFKSRVSMLERVLQSLNVENQELNWQLGESLNLQQLSKKGLSNLSSSSTPTSSFKSVRKSSSLPPQASRKSTLNFAKSRLLSSTGSFLDSTAEESEEFDSNQMQVTRAKCRPFQASTPFQRPKGTVIESPDLPASFYSLKKCLKSGHTLDSEGGSFKSARSSSCDIPDFDIPEACVRTRPSPQSQKPLTLTSGNVSKFPFNTILEKLKANSEVRLSRSSSAKLGDATASAPNKEVEGCGDGLYSRYSKSPQGGGKSGAQAKKSGNIHQRIQNILDRIVAESEEAS